MRNWGFVRGSECGERRGARNRWDRGQGREAQSGAFRHWREKGQRFLVERERGRERNGSQNQRGKKVKEVKVWERWKTTNNRERERVQTSTTHVWRHLPRGATVRFWDGWSGVPLVFPTTEQNIQRCLVLNKNTHLPVNVYPQCFFSFPFLFLVFVFIFLANYKLSKHDSTEI